MPSSKPAPNRLSMASSTAPSSQSHHSERSIHRTLVSTLKKPFQGWSRELLAARDGLDDDYNFPGVNWGDESRYRGYRNDA